MRVSIRLAFAVLMVVLSSIAFSATAQAAGPGPGPGSGNLPAGSYHFTTVSANFNFFGTSPYPQISVYVNATTQVSKPDRGPSTTTTETDVNISDNTPPYAYACFALTNPSDFSVKAGLAGAALNTTITQTTPGCTNYPPNYFSAFPLTIAVTWTGTGPIATGQDHSALTCGSYKSESTSVNVSNVGTATASLTPLVSNALDGQGGLGTSDQRIQAQGVSQDTCSPAFGGKGTGFGPQPPGTYRFASLQAGANFQPASGGQVGFFVSNFTNTLQPEGGTKSVVHEIDLSIFIFTGVSGGFMCFVIPSTDFTSTGVQTAALQTTVDVTTPLCNNGPGPGPGSLPLPLTLNATWTGVGPTSILHDESTYSCDKFSIHGQNVITSNSANIAATLTPAFTDAFASTQGSLVTGDQHTEIKGVQSQACLVR